MNVTSNDRGASNLRRAWRAYGETHPSVRQFALSGWDWLDRIMRPPRFAKRTVVDTGYLRSVLSKEPVDGAGEPIPWYTFPATAYLRQLDFSGKRVFEYGSGNSTVFWQRRADEVVAVERAPDWHAQVLTLIDPAVTTLLLEPERERYLSAIENGDIEWDVIVIDGEYRLGCAPRALKRLAPGGFVILDNADWFPQVAAELRAGGLLEVDFHGTGPINVYAWTTAVFFDRRAEPVTRPVHPGRPEGGVAPPYMDPGLL